MATGRLILQFRLMAAYVYESRQVMDQLKDCPGFGDLLAKLPTEVVCELTELQSLVIKKAGYTSSNWGIDEVIRRSRHATSFHYDLNETIEALKRWPGTGYKGGQEGHFLVEFDDQDRAWPYYGFADIIRGEAAFGFGNEHFDANFGAIMEVTRKLKSVVQSYSLLTLKWRASAILCTAAPSSQRRVDSQSESGSSSVR